MIDEIIIYASKSKGGASDALKTLKRLEKQGEIAVLAAASILVDSAGVADITENRHAAANVGGAFGAFAGALLGAIGGPVGLAIGASLGGLAGGKLASNVEHRLSGEAFGELRDYLVPDSSVLVAAIEKEFSAIVLDTLKELRFDGLTGLAIRRPVSVEENDALRALET